MSTASFEEGFFGELAALGELGYMGKALAPKTRAECLRDGGSWNTATKTCSEGAHVAAPAPAPAKATRADTQAQKAAQALDRQKAACMRKGNIWDGLRQICTSAAAARTPASGPVATTATAAPAPVTATKQRPKDLKADCLGKGGVWNANKKTCALKVVEGQIVPATPTNAAMCKAQNGTWYTANRKCVTPADLAACTAQGYAIVQGVCKAPVSVTEKPAKPGKAEKPAKAQTQQQVCVAAGGQWFPGVRKCMTKEELAVCVAQGGSAVKGGCKMPKGVVPPIAPITVAQTPPLITPTTQWPQVNQYINCMTQMRRGYKRGGCRQPTSGQFQGAGWPQYFACVQQSIAGGTNQTCVPPGGPAPIGQCPTGYTWDAQANACKPVLSPCPSGYSWSEASQACVPDITTPAPTTVPPVLCPSGYAYDAAQGGCVLTAQPAPVPPSSDITGGTPSTGFPSVSGGAGGAGEPWLSPEGVPGADTGAGAAPGAAGPMTECDPGFNATLPQTYNDQWGPMVVLQVYCKQQTQAPAGVPQDFAPQQQVASAFQTFADTQPAQAITGSVGTPGVRPISQVEAEEMSFDTAGGGGGGFGGW